VFDVFAKTLRELERFVVRVESAVPQLQFQPFLNHFVFRYQEQTPQQALVQKLARNVSGLYGATVLCRAGLGQEQSALNRILDDIQEDITFLCFGLSESELPDIHKRYLEAFWEEEFDRPEDPLRSTQKRALIPRQKIRAYVSGQEAMPTDQSRAVELFRTLNKAYSGFVHAASPQIMNMYGGNPGRFHCSGMLGTPREVESIRDLRTYIYRGILAFGFVAQSLEDHDLFRRVITLRDAFEIESGMRESEPNPEFQPPPSTDPEGAGR
jgi:hypothetical protein